MQFCQDHWERLREKIDDRGLSALVADTGEEAAHRLARSIDGEDTIDSFEPLMEAHMAIAGNVLEYLKKTGPGAIPYIAQSSEIPEDKVDPAVYGSAAIGRTWPRCPLCYINQAHELTCSGCEIPKVGGFDWMLDNAADDVLAHWERLGE